MLASARHGFPLVMLRPPVLLGPGDTDGRSTATLRRYLGRRLPFMIQGGMHVTDIRDVATSVVAACLHPAPRQAYHLPGTAEGLPEFLARCERLCGVPAPRRIAPFWLAWAAATASARLARALGRRSWLPDPVSIEMGHHHWGLSSRYAQEELGYRPRPVDETLSETLAWLQANP
jgi:nucleoside-diphosphate-sugar epimerase